MDILRIAAESGMQVILDGRIGSEEYRSVVGSVQALHRFADALCKSIVDETETNRVPVKSSATYIDDLDWYPRINTRD
ncbi:hypothetical protein DM39_4150 [Burkholderia cenocepacia]|uniref:Uncharacterized protein n=1 Tax=Burkholderia cenocepacia TaxID=95486 RepID=A0AAN0RW67_9BURK|nr:hypothetical protein DM39_4150 [Burkholderia cenocepacia]